MRENGEDEEEEYEQHLGTGQAVNKRLVGGLGVRAGPLARNFKAMLAAEEERMKKAPAKNSNSNGRPPLSSKGRFPPPSEDPMLSPEQRADYLRSEYYHAWAQMQEEWILMLSDLVKITPRTMGSLADFSLGQTTSGQGASGGFTPNGVSEGDGSSYGMAALRGGIDSVQAGANKVASELNKINGWISNMAEVAEQVLGGNLSAVTPLGQQKILIEQDRKKRQRMVRDESECMRHSSALSPNGFSHLCFLYL
jgi:hypothetical protein